ncbi:MAG TPA: hypothetical protein VIR02_20225 [Anaerolineales bacterium]|jgi:hypothetical protein
MAKNRNQFPSVTVQGQNAVGFINASGSSRVNLKQQVIQQTSPEMEDLFKHLNRKIRRRKGSQVDKTRLENQVRKIEAEAAKGSAADPGKLERWIKTLANMAPDIVEVMAASLAGPVAGFTLVFKKIVERARAASAQA